MTDAAELKERPFRALRHREFLMLWMANGISLTGSQMQSVAIHWHVWLLTKSPLALGAVGLTRVLPIILFSLMGGVAADRYDRRRLMLTMQVVMALVAVGLALMTSRHVQSIALLYFLNAVSAAATAFDNPARQAFVPRLVPRRDLPDAIRLNLTVFYVATVLGPALFGLLVVGGSASLASLSPEEPGAIGAADLRRLPLIYWLNAASFVGVIASLLAMRTSGRVEAEGGEHPPPLESLRLGLRFVFRTPIMVWTMALDFFATLFSGAMSLLPVFADKIFHVGADGYGLLVAAPALGAVAGAIYTSACPLPTRQGRILLWSVAAYGATTIVWGLSRSYWLTFAALAATGLADLVSTVIRQTLRQIITPDSLRGRMTAVNMIFFMGGPQLGEFEAGLVAAAFASAATGATVSVVSGGVITVVLVAVVAAAAPVVRNYDLRGYLEPHSTRS